MKYYEKKDFNPGGFKDREDSRDFKLEEIAGAQAVPFNWNVGYDIENELKIRLQNPNFKMPVKDQGGSFSCGGQSWSYYAAVLEAIATGTFEERSAKFLYAQTYVPGGGSRGRDNADIFINQGAAREAILTSYQAGKPPTEPFITRSQDITDLVRLDAKLAKALAYAQTGFNIEAVSIAIRDNYGVVLGIDGSNNGTWASAFPAPPSSVEWRHWIYCGKAKIINGKKHIGLLNSWGSDVGENGWQWLSEDYFKKNVWSGWTHVFAPIPVVGFTHKFTKDIRYGQASDEVIALQKVLQIHGYFPSSIPTTGSYFDITKRAVLAFQRANGIFNTTGNIVGPSTRIKLNLLI